MKNGNMTVDEYKKLIPEHNHLEGDALWNAMEDYMLVHQDNSEPILTEEEEVEYQKALVADRDWWASQGVISINYNRRFWYNMDRVEKRAPDAPPLSSAKFIVFDVSDKPKEDDTDKESKERGYM